MFEGLQGLTDAEAKILIDRRERQMLVHSYIYYRRNENVWTDQEFDLRGRELVELIRLYPKVAETCEWAAHFRNWDATTGYHLPLDHPWVREIGELVLKRHLEAWAFTKSKAEVKEEPKVEIKPVEKVKAQATLFEVKKTEPKPKPQKKDNKNQMKLF